MTTTGEWAASRDQAKNFGFIRFFPNNGQSLEFVAGFQGYLYGDTQARPTTYWGYQGTTPRYCRGGSYAVVTFRQNGLNCTIGGGSGGGPWLTNYTDSSGLGQIFCVNAGTSGNASVCSYQDAAWFDFFTGFGG